MNVHAPAVPVRPAVQAAVSWWRTDVGAGEIAKVVESIRAERISGGPVTAELERAIGSVLGVPYVVCTPSGTMALKLALTTLGIGPGDEVIVPDRTFIATAHAALMLGAKVRLVDVLPDRPVLDVAQIEAHITPRTKAILPVHLNGRAVDMAALNEIARRRGVRVVEDAAQAFLSRGPGGWLGTHSDIGCFSLGMTKLVSTGQGGFCVTRDEDLYRRMRLVQNQGVVDTLSDDYELRGFNCKFNDVLASLGVVQLERRAEKITRVTQVYEAYREFLDRLRILSIIPVMVENGESRCGPKRWRSTPRSERPCWRSSSGAVFTLGASCLTCIALHTWRRPGRSGTRAPSTNAGSHCRAGLRSRWRTWRAPLRPSRNMRTATALDPHPRGHCELGDPDGAVLRLIASVFDHPGRPSLTRFLPVAGDRVWSWRDGHGGIAAALLARTWRLPDGLAGVNLGYICTRPDLRRTGVGSRFVAAVTEEELGRGARFVLAWARDYLVSFYEDLCFTRLGEEAFCTVVPGEPAAAGEGAETVDFEAVAHGHGRPAARAPLCRRAPPRGRDVARHQPGVSLGRASRAAVGWRCRRSAVVGRSGGGRRWDCDGPGVRRPAGALRRGRRVRSRPLRWTDGAGQPDRCRVGADVGRHARA